MWRTDKYIWKCESSCDCLQNCRRYLSQVLIDVCKVIEVIDVGMPLLLANHPTSIGAAQLAYGMLLDYNNFYVMNRLNADDEHKFKYLNELSPKRSAEDAKKLSLMDESRPTVLPTVGESFSYQPNYDLFYQNHIQNKQFKAQQQMLQQIDGAGATTTTTPLQHLNNLFGLKVPLTTTSTSGFPTSGMFDSNSLQYFSAAMQSEREQYEKIVREFYADKVPQLGKGNTKMHQQQQLMQQEQLTTAGTADVMATDLQNKLIQAPTVTALPNSSKATPRATLTGAKDAVLSALIFEGDMRNSSMNINSSGHAGLLAATNNEISHAEPKSPAATTTTSTSATVAGKSQIKARSLVAVAETPEMVAVEAATTIQPSAISSQSKRSTKGMQNFNG